MWIQLDKKSTPQYLEENITKKFDREPRITIFSSTEEIKKQTDFALFDVKIKINRINKLCKININKNKINK